MASATALGNRGVRGHHVLTFISITVPANSALASLQASRKSNKVEGCVLSSRSEEQQQKGRSRCRKTLPANDIPGHSSPRRPGWTGLGLCKKAGGAGERHDLRSKQCLFKFDLDRSQPRSLFTLMKRDGTDCPWKAMSQTAPRFKRVPRFVSNADRGAFL